MSLEIAIKSVGISFVNQRPVEIVYADIRDISIAYRDTSVHRTLGLTMGDLQVNNQLLDAYDPIVLRSSGVIPDDSNIEIPPIFQTAIVKSKIESIYDLIIADFI